MKLSKELVAAASWVAGTIPLLAALFIELELGPFSLCWILWTGITGHIVLRMIDKNNTGGQQA